MPADRRLVAAFKGFAEAVLPDTTLAQERAVRGVINDDATVRPESVTGAIPWQRVDIPLAGAVVASAANARIAMPQGGVIRHIATSARVAPAGIFRYSISDGTTTEWFSLQSGVSQTMQGINWTITPGSWLVLGVAEAASTEDALISLHFTAGGA